MILKSIQNFTLQEAVYNELYEAIIEGKITPGERLTLRQLSTDLNVSMMPVREAIRRLEAKHFVIIEKNKQIIVNELTPSHFAQILDARLLLEGHVVKAACKIRSEESLEELNKFHNQIKEATDADTILRVNRQFHRCIYKEADLPVFLNIIDSLWERVSPYLYMYSRNQSLEGKKDFMQFHVGMIKGMTEKNPADVCKWLKKDLFDAAENINEILEKSAANKK